MRPVYRPCSHPSPSDEYETLVRPIKHHPWQRPPQDRVKLYFCRRQFNISLGLGCINWLGCNQVRYQARLCHFRGPVPPQLNQPPNTSIACFGPKLELRCRLFVL
jgi:hypothetical protein